MGKDVIGGRVSLVAEDGQCENFHRSVRALPAARGHAGRITCRYDIAGQNLNSRLCRIPASGAGEESERVRELQRQWTRWNPGVPLRVLRTEYASVARPIVAFVDRLRRHCNEPVIVLIPVALPDRLRYRFLHNHVDLVLTRELRCRPDVVVARVPVRVHVHGRAAPLRTPVTRSRAQAKASRGRYQPGGCARP